MSREYLTTPIQRLPDDQRGALGIFQSDIVIRTAIVAGLADLRENPKLLDYVFASLPKDDLTYNIYGEEEAAKAKKWFLDNDVPVFMNTRIDESKVPCITIGIAAAGEAGATLGDVHYDTTIPDSDKSSVIYGGPFTPAKYEASTGLLTFKSDFSLEVFPGQFIKDSNGKLHEVLEVIDSLTVEIAPNLNVPFTNSWLVSAPAARSVSMESVEFRESYEIGCHALGDPVILTYLYSIALFILLRYKEALIEARGLTRTSINAGPVVLNTSFQTTQPVFTRMITLNGFVHQYWPKFFSEPVVGTTQAIREVNEDGTADNIFEINEDGSSDGIFEET